MLDDPADGHHRRPLPDGRSGVLPVIAVGDDILCALTWSADLTMVCAVTCRFACVSR